MMFFAVSERAGDPDTIGMLVVVLLVLLALLLADVVIEIKHWYDGPPKDRR